MQNEVIKIKAITAREELIAALEDEKLSSEERKKILELLHQTEQQYGQLDSNMYA